MGALLFTLSVEPCNTAALKYKFADLQEDARYENGEKFDNGSLHHCHLEISNQRFASRAKFEEYERIHHIHERMQKSLATAFAIGDVEKYSFENFSKKNMQLLKKRNDIGMDMHAYYYKIFCRTIQAKSLSRTCKYCDSSISKRAMLMQAQKDPAFQKQKTKLAYMIKVVGRVSDLASELERLPPMPWRKDHQTLFTADSHHFDKLDRFWAPALPEYLRCPCCGSDDLILTTQDKAALKSLNERFDKAAKELNEARRIYKEKIESKDVYWHIVAKAPW